MWRMMQIGAVVQVRLFLAYDGFIFTVLRFGPVCSGL